VDMGLWTASKLQDVSPHWNRMHKDEFFQETRLKNLLQGPGSLFPPLKGEMIDTQMN